MADPITAEIIRNHLDTIAEQIFETICRSSPNSVVNETKDCGAGIYSYDGSTSKMVSRAGIIAHSFAGLSSSQTVLDFFRGDLHPGDALLVADSYHGGSHLGCWNVVVPVFFDGKPRFLTGGRLHVLDQGGPMAGAVNPQCREIWHEGFRIPPMKLYEKGARRRELWDWLMANNRLPDITEADVETMIGACRVGENQITELVERHGLEQVEDSLEWIFGYSERKFRDQVSAWPDGTYHGRFTVDSDYADHTDIDIRVAVTIDDDHMIVDFEGTDPQTDGLVNSVPANTIAYVSIALSALCPQIPVNSGFYEPVEIKMPEGTIVNAVSPAATVLGTIVCGGQIGQAVMKAFEQFVPQRVANVSIDIANNYCFGTDDREDRFLVASSSNPRQFFFWDMSPVAMSSSAAYGQDGWGAWATPFSVSRPANNEFTEVQFPTIYHQGEYAIDSAAPGQWRGSPAYIMRRTDRGASSTFATFNSQSLIHPLPGYAGGYEGTGNFCIIGENADEAICGEHMVAQTYDPSQVIFSHSGGGGGWGDPLDRDTEAVLDDVLDELVSLEGARHDYGVVIDPTTWTIDREATEHERARQRAEPSRTRRGLGREKAIQRAHIRHRIR
ncbi:hydantoinase B/oxoprolinase family protein [Sciscionella sediminilitoris]|uniref:hydantoinase B/oxoprolinase family protein n=1 Tax=Sciscionella sediminilitoris TaxID=1445613 RepID=UPI0004DF9CF3|nr:hydantoinase B/oxoprolinase family protein [Sciscionella sp. SE31]